MDHRRTDIEKSTCGRINPLWFVAALLATVFVFGIVPSRSVSAAETTGYVFRDETPDETGIPAYYHKGVKYGELNENEKKVFNQMILLHRYLIGEQNDYANCFDLNPNVEVDGKKAFKINFNMSGGEAFKVPDFEIQVIKSASGSAVEYYTADELGNKNDIVATEACLRAREEVIDLTKVINALTVDVPDLFWWDKQSNYWDFSMAPLPDNRVNVYGLVLYVSREKPNDSYITKGQIASTMQKINLFADSVIKAVESKEYWNYIKGGTVETVPEILSDYDKLLGVSMMLGKLMAYDRSQPVKETSFGIDCIITGNIDLTDEFYKNYDNQILAVCEGYSELYKYICDKIRFDNKVMVGLEYGYVGLGEEAITNYNKHEWNVIIIPGMGSYVTDLTTDDEMTFLVLDQNQTCPNLEYKYNRILFARAVDPLTYRDDLYYVLYRVRYENLSTNDMSTGYKFVGPNDPEAAYMRPITESVRYANLATEEFVKPTGTVNIQKKDASGLFVDDSAFANAGSESVELEYRGNDPLRQIVVSNVQGTAIIELAKEENVSGLIGPSSGREIVFRETMTDGKYQIDMSSYAPGAYSIYVYGMSGDYVYPIKKYSFVTTQKTITASVAGKNGQSVAMESGDLSADSTDMIGTDLVNKLDVVLNGVADADKSDVSASIVGLTVQKLTPATIQANGTARVTVTIELTGTKSGYYKLDNNSKVITADDVVIISKIVLPVSRIEAAPVAIEGLKYNGQELALIREGRASLGSVVYAVVSGESNNEPADSAYRNAIPKAKTVGKYTIWYKVLSTDEYTGTEAGKVVAEITEQSQSGGGMAGGGSTGGGSTGGGSTGGGMAGGGSTGGGSMGGGSMGGGSTGGGSMGGGSTGGGAAGGNGASADEDKESSEKDDKSADKGAEDKQDKAGDNKTSGEGKTAEKKPEAVTNEDGSTTTTNTTVNKKGSVIVESKTENADGSTVESVVKTTKSGKITETTVEKDADGNVTATVEKTVKTAKADKDGKVKTTANTTETDAEGNTVRTKETTVVDKKGNTEITSKKTEKDSNGKTTLTTTTTAVLNKKGSGTVEVEKKSAGGASVTESYSVSSKGVVKLTGIEVKGDELVIPETVEVSGEAVPVTMIGKNAMKNNKSLTSAVIGENITTIGAGAFSGNKNLANIELTGSITKISKNAFKNIAGNAVFTIRGTQEDLERITKLLKESGISEGVTIVLAD